MYSDFLRNDFLFKPDSVEVGLMDLLLVLVEVCFL